MGVERRLGELERESERMRLILSGDLTTVGLIENVRGLTTLVGEMRQRQESIAQDIAALKRLEQTKANVREGEEKAARRLRRFFYVVGTLMLGASGSLLTFLGRMLVTLGVPP